MSRITRKELKSDKFALEVEHSVTFLEEHQKEMIRYGGIAVVVILLVVGYMVYSGRQHSARQEALAKAIQVQETPVGPPTPGQNVNFPTQASKDEVALRTFGELKTKYSGSEEAEIAQYYIGSILADQGKLADSTAVFKEVAEKGDAKYASLAKFSLAQLQFAQGLADQGEATLRDLMAHPTIYVSKDQAAISLARFISAKKPAEARKLLDPLRGLQGPVGQQALTVYSELPPQ